MTRYCFYTLTSIFINQGVLSKSESRSADIVMHCLFPGCPKMSGLYADCLPECDATRAILTYRNIRLFNTYVDAYG